MLVDDFGSLCYADLVTQVERIAAFLQNELALQVHMSDRLAVSLGYAVRHNTDPPAGFGKTDTLTTVNIVYEMK